MTYYEKAIDNYAKERKEFHEAELKKEIANFNKRIERMVGAGECPVCCETCPLWLFPEYRDYRACDKLTKERIHGAFRVHNKQDDGQDKKGGRKRRLRELRERILSALVAEQGKPARRLPESC